MTMFNITMHDISEVERVVWNENPVQKFRIVDLDCIFSVLVAKILICFSYRGNMLCDTICIQQEHLSLVMNRTYHQYLSIVPLAILSILWYRTRFTFLCAFDDIASGVDYGCWHIPIRHFLDRKWAHQQNSAWAGFEFPV